MKEADKEDTFEDIEVHLGSSQLLYKMAFNKACNKFALMKNQREKMNLEEKSSIFVYDFDTPLGLIKAIKALETNTEKKDKSNFTMTINEKTIYVFGLENKDTQDYIKWLEFDQNDKYIVGYGDTKIQIMKFDQS